MVEWSVRRRMPTSQPPKLTSVQESTAIRGGSAIHEKNTAGAEGAARLQSADRGKKAGTVAADVEVADTGLLLALTGPEARRLSILEQEFGIEAGLRGNTIRLKGAEGDVRKAERALAELFDALQHGATMSDADMAFSIRTLQQDPEVKLRNVFQDVVLTAMRGRKVTPKGLAQKRYVEAIRTHDIVFGVGPAGTGKTYLAMAMAVSDLRQQRISRIILASPAVEAGEKLGFLPGDLAEKVNPYLRPLYDALHDMMDPETAHGLITRGSIEVAPLAFMRGRTLNDSFVILDEAQNTTIPQMKMFLTRLGVCSKAVITGDVTQVDLPEATSSGLSDALQLLDNTTGIKCCWFTDQDVVRHALVERIVQAYDRRDAGQAASAPRAPIDAR